LENIALAWVGSSIVQGSFAIWQFFAQYVFANKWLGLAEHIPMVKGSIILQTYSERWLRSYGSLPHPNMLGGFLAIGILFLFYLAFFGKTSFQRKLVLLGILTIVPGLFFSFCRSAELALVVCFFVLAAWILLQKNKEWKKTLFQFSVLVFMIVSVLSWNMLDPVLTRIVSNKPLETHSIEERMLFQGQSVNLISNDWLLGQGIGNYTLAIYQKINATWPGYYYQPVHNIYLLVFSETGIFGLLTFGLAVILLFIQFFLARKIENKDLRLKQLILFLMFISILIISLFDHYFWTLYFGVMVFWLILGLSLKQLKTL
jgi:O-antigen ligase